MFHKASVPGAVGVSGAPHSSCLCGHPSPEGRCAGAVSDRQVEPRSRAPALPGIGAEPSALLGDIPTGFQGQKSFPHHKVPSKAQAPRGFWDVNPKSISHSKEALSWATGLLSWCLGHGQSPEGEGAPSPLLSRAQERRRQSLGDTGKVRGMRPFWGQGKASLLP